MVTRFEGAIIAAGHGERLRAGGEQLPKPLVQLHGEPLLVRQARMMIAVGAQRVLAVVNSDTARIARDLGVIMPQRMQLIVRDTPSSMESLFTLGEHLSPGRFLMATVDAVAPAGELARFTRQAFAASDERQVDGILAVARWRGDRRPLFVHIQPDGIISRVGLEQGSIVTAGFYLLPTRVFDFVREARTLRLGALREFLATLVARGLRFKAVEFSSVIDIDEVTDLEAAESMVAGGRAVGSGR